MAKYCEICTRKAVTGNARSHSNISTKRKMSLNLQTKRIGQRKFTICTSCIRTLKKLKKKTTI